MRVEEFVWSEMEEILYITWDELKSKMGEEIYKKFLEWMGGQTCLEYGAYISDVSRFLNNQPIID